MASTGYAVSKLSDHPQFTERRVFCSMVDRSTPPAVIMDVGANVGQSALRFASQFPQSTIYALEPFQAAFEALCLNLKSFPNVRPFRLAAGSQNGPRSALRNEEVASQVNSLVDHRQAMLADKGTAETIELVTLDDFCHQNGIASIDLLKTDTEGYDLEVLKGGTKLLDQGRIKAIICEVGVSGDFCHTNLFEAAEFLKLYQLEAAGFYETDFLFDGRFSHTNALFVHRR